MSAPHDPFVGTVYRDLTDAEDALDMARYTGHEDGIGYDPARAIIEINAALAALTAARAKLEGAAAASAGEVELDDRETVYLNPLPSALVHEYAGKLRRVPEPTSAAQTPAGVNPQTALAGPDENIPDDFYTRLAISDAERTIAEVSAGRWSAVTVEDTAEHRIVHSVRTGETMQARAATIELALLRDARPTLAELNASIAARAEYKAVA